MLNNVPSINHWHKGVPNSVKTPTRAGMFVLLVWVLGFGSWSTLAPLDGAIVTQGTFVATGQNKQIQHFEGGMVREILVKEGDLVQAGQALVRLDDTSSKARLRRLEVRSLRLAAMRARLAAEAKGEKDWILPPSLSTAANEAEVKEIVDSQITEMKARRTKREDEEQVLRKEIAGLNESIIGYRSQADATKQQMKLFKEELADKRNLYKRQLARRADVLGLERTDARLGGDLGQLMSRIADSQERVSRAEQQIAQINSTAVQKAVEELRLTETELDDINEQIRAARDVMDRVAIAAPVRGVVVKLNFHTAGGVVAPGATLLELLPVNDELIIESRIAPSDIAHVKEGQKAQVRLSSVNQRIVPMIDATVAYVSADTVNEQDPRRLAMSPQLAHGAFVVRVKLDAADLLAKAHGFQPMPGMPADIFIKTEERTFSQYLLKPLRDSLTHAFRES